jgi:hypothetical protein
MENYKPKTKLGIALGKAGAWVARLFTPNRHVQTEPEQGHAGQDNGNADSQQPSAATLPVVEQPIHPTVDEPKPEQPPSRSRQEEQPAAPQKRARMLQAWLIINSALTLIVAISQAYCDRGQWRAADKQAQHMNRQTELMSKQLESMESSSNDTRQMIRETQRMANASENTATHFKGIAEATNKQANASQTLANASGAQVKAAEGAVAATLKGVDVATQSMKVGNRAYVAIRQADLSTLLKDVDTAKVTVFFENRGGTPARNVRTRLYSNFLPAEPSELKFEQFRGGQSTAFLLPGGYVTNDIQTQTVNASQRAILFQRGYRLYIWGDVEYDDVFGKHWRTQFCAYNRDLATVRFTACANHNTLQ